MLRKTVMASLSLNTSSAAPRIFKQLSHFEEQVTKFFVIDSIDEDRDDDCYQQY